MKRGGLDPEDVFVVRNGPDLKTFKPVTPNPTEVRQALSGGLRRHHECPGRPGHPADVAQHIKN